MDYEPDDENNLNNSYRDTGNIGDAEWCGERFLQNFQTPPGYLSLDSGKPRESEGCHPAGE